MNDREGNPEAVATPPAIRTECLTRNFGPLVAVDHLDLAIPAGSIFGLVGPNGAGKTTTIKMLTTLLPPTTGRAEVAGFDVHKQPRAVRRSHRLRPAAPLRRRRTDRPREPHAVCPPVRQCHGTSVGANPSGSGDDGPHRSGGYLGAALLGGHDSPPGDRPGHAASARGALPGRTHRRARPCGAARRLGSREGAANPFRRHDSADHTLHGGGRGPLRPGGDHAPGPGRGRMGSPELNSSSGRRGDTLDDVFVSFTGSAIETGGSYRDTAKTRRTARRLG